MKKFSGESSSKISYMELNDNQRELVSIKGKHGDTLNHILTWAEQRGDKQVTDRDLGRMENLIPKIWEFNRAVHAALKNWTEGDANKVVKYGANGGIDAWRRLYAECIPLAQTKQDIILIEILEVKPANDKNIRKLLNRMEELQYKCNQCGGQFFGNNIIKRMLVKCPPKEIIKPLALHMDTATSSPQMRKLIMRQQHDEMIGMLDGDNARPLCSVNQDSQESKQAEGSLQTIDLQQAGKNLTKVEQDYWAAALGQKGKTGKGGKSKGGKSKGKGYGECWNCGQQGHPARECPVAVKLHGGVGNKGDSKGIGMASAFKGKGKSRGKNGWKGNKGWKGKGKGQGKQSINVATDLEYAAAWNVEDDKYWPDYSEEYQDYSNGHNYACNNSHEDWQVPKHYSMMLTKIATKVTSGPRYFPAELNEDDDEDDEEDEEEQNSDCNCTESRRHATSGNQIKKKRWVNNKIKNTQVVGEWKNVGKNGKQSITRPNNTTTTRPITITRAHNNTTTRPITTTRPHNTTNDTTNRPHYQPTTQLIDKCRHRSGEKHGMKQMVCHGQSTRGVPVTHVDSGLHGAGASIAESIPDGPGASVDNKVGITQASHAAESWNSGARTLAAGRFSFARCPEASDEAVRDAAAVD